MDRSDILLATSNQTPSDRVKFWSTFQSTLELPSPSFATGSAADDVSAVVAGSKPATILRAEALADPLIKRLITQEAKQSTPLSMTKSVNYYGCPLYFLGKTANVTALAALYHGRGGDDSPLPADESFHRAVGAALGYPAEAIDNYITRISETK